MPANDPMYTVAQAEKLKKTLPENHPLHDDINKVQKDAIAAASASARAVVDLFTILDIAVNDSDRAISSKAKEIYKSPFLVEVA